MIVDLHAHYHPRACEEALARLPGRTRVTGWAPYSEDEAAAVEATRVGNDTIAALASRMPDKFKALVSLPLPHVDPSLRDLPEPPSVTARRFYYDTVGHGSHAALTCAWKAFGADHLVPGSDFPVLLNFGTYARTFAWIREAGLPPDDVEQILEKNAPHLLGLGDAVAAGG